MINLLELFAGSRSIGKKAEEMGFNVFSVDINNFEGINLIKDIEHLTIKDIPFKPNIIWASPPCTSYSIAAIKYHRNNNEPKTDFAKKSDKMIKNVLNIINHFNCIYYIENPVGMLRKMDFMRGMNRTTVTYCSYNDNRMKPTDIFSNNIYDMFNLTGWRPRPLCYNNNKHCQHEAAPRGSRTGTQGIKGNYNRSKIPTELCNEILTTTKNQLNNEQYIKTSNI